MIPKFRAWDKSNKKMCDVKALSAFNDGEVTIKRDGENASYVVPIERVILMQSTGLFDKNGVEVFDGDIVNAYDTDRNEGQIYKTVNLTGVVTYHENAFCLKQGNVLNDLWVHSEEFEVIGNIYENPELLESVEG